MKTLQEIKDEVAQRAGYNNWTEVCVYFIESPRRNALDDEVAQSYARQAWKEAARLQRENCKKNIVLPEDHDTRDIWEQILNTPEPEFKV